ncbi:MAG: leucyl aminopeptidase [Oligoflexia bacterium]|nr:leucyl aminopeptidase [Oligoflexia bacterium]
MRKLTTLEARTTSAGAVDVDVIAVFQDSGKKPIPPRSVYSGAVERLRRGDAFVARHGSTQFVRFGGKGSAESCLLVGFGAAAELTEEKVRSAGGNAWSRLVAEKCKTATIHIDTLFAAKGLPREPGHARLARAFAEGLVLGAYQFLKHKSSAKSGDDGYAGPAKISFLTQEKALKKQLDTELGQVMDIAECVQVTRDWSNEPSNHGTPEFYAAEARKLAKQHGLKITVLTEADAAREKMGLYLGVGQGAEREGRIVVLEYTPKGVKNPKTIAFVGKGITFDSGGISIKPSARMEEMKHDMTGAATVMGATMLAARWGAPNRIVAIMAFTENMPDGKAIQPGNVITARSGKTVEVINTDAEGRLILADVLDYAQDFKPDAVLDVATLTGAVSIALGKQAAGILGNDDQLVESIRRAGEVNGERLWQLPMWDEYFEDLKSDTADMKNSANDGYGGTIRGAMFLKQFIRKGTQWAHVDIAATAWAVGHLSYIPKRGASGLFVRTLAQFATDF